MRFGSFVRAAGLLIVFSPAVAGAQEQREVGVTMGHPGSVGVLWHVSERAAVRPEFQFSFGTSESTTPGSAGTSSSEGWSVSPGISALIYLQRWDDLRTYVSPRLTFTRSTNSFLPDGSGTTARSTNTTYSGAASFGTQYSLGERFSIFAEAGMGMSRTTGSSELSSTETTGWQWTTRTGIGAVLYF